uniref:Tctex1 domain-containing protein 2 n=1 Tax=Timema bartmani TaxID=61472 RepID=A0A7R9F3Q9_9NEOP|nr:unnamed protein product [Timema bartmani]
MDITSEIEIEAKRALEEEDNPEPLARASAPVSTYQMRPNLNDRFKAQTVKEMIHSVLNDELGGKIYNAEEAEVWTKTITSAVRNKIKDLGFQRYKFMVQVILGEQHGAGVKTGARCLWDADTDNYASAVFLNIGGGIPTTDSYRLIVWEFSGRIAHVLVTFASDTVLVFSEIAIVCSLIARSIINNSVSGGVGISKNVKIVTEEKMVQ